MDLVIALQNIGGEALAWLRNGFSAPLHFGVVALASLGKAFWVALPYMKAYLVIVLLVYFCLIFWSVCFGGVRMMRALGMGCIRIPRALFEASPRIYFIIQRIILGVYRSICALFRGLAVLLLVIALVNIGGEALARLRNGFSDPCPHFVVDKLKEGSIAEAFALLRNGNFSAPCLDFVVDKLMKEGAITIEHFGEVALAWLGKAFRVALPYMKDVLVIVLVVYFWRIFWSVCFGGMKMMRAPGMPCIRIPRALFKASPRIYFFIQRIILGVYRSILALFRGLAVLLLLSSFTWICLDLWDGLSFVPGRK